MMRRLHRWFGLITSVIMAFVAATGIIMQVMDLFNIDDQQGPGAPGGGLRLRDLIDHLHDGEYFGNTGRVISLLMGVALFFFFVSGIWMYWQMLRARSELGKKGLFW